MYAAWHPMDDRRVPWLVSELIRAGADVNARTQAGDTALSAAPLHGRDAAAVLLQAAGAR